MANIVTTGPLSWEQLRRQHSSSSPRSRTLNAFPQISLIFRSPTQRCNAFDSQQTGSMNWSLSWFGWDFFVALQGKWSESRERFRPGWIDPEWRADLDCDRHKWASLTLLKYKSTRGSDPDCMRCWTAALHRSDPFEAASEWRAGFGRRTTRCTTGSRISSPCIPWADRSRPDRDPWTLTFGCNAVCARSLSTSYRPF